MLAVLAGGCTINSPLPVEGWPELRIVEHKVSGAEVRARCEDYGSAMTALACSQVNFRESRCDIWYGSVGLLRPWVLAHEREHCRGHDHLGQGSMERALKAWRERSG
jgi:hypothetical protein